MINETVNSLQAEIVEMENIVLYYQTRILRKQIAVEEIVQGAVCKMNVPMRVTAAAVVVKPAEQQFHGQLEPPGYDPKPIPVTSMIHSVLPEFKTINGKKIGYKRLKQRCIKRYPQHRAKIMTGFYQSCLRLISEGVQIEAPPIKQKKEKSIWALDPNRSLESFPATNGENQAIVRP